MRLRHSLPAALLVIPLLFALAICIADPSFAQQAQAATDGAIAVQSAADYPVGFTVITLRDSSRAWESLPNAVVRGKASLFIPRPVRISVWYPARAESGPHMRVADYLTHAGITDSLAQRVSQNLDARDHRTFIAQALDGATGLFDSASAFPLSAVRGAPPKGGRFPLVLYSAGLNSFDTDNAILAETLARRGYVVATVAQQGMSADRIDLSLAPADVETQVRDLEIAASTLRRRQDVDGTRAGIMGWSMGGVAALLFQMRHPEVSAVVTLDPSFGFRDHPSQIQRAPGFAPLRMTVPLLVLAEASADASDAIVDSLAYSDREVIRFPGIVHEDFTMEAELSTVLDSRSGRRSSAYPAVASRIINAYVVAFMDANLRGDSAQITVLRAQPLTYDAPAGSIKRHRKSRQRPVFTANELALLIERSGFDTAVSIVTVKGTTLVPKATIRESEVNTLAYAYLNRGDGFFALKLFRINTLAFPRSANTFDGLADALIATGDSRGAAEAYRRVLELLPGDSSLSSSTREALRNNAVRFLGGVTTPQS